MKNNKSNFISDCLLFRKKESFYIITGIAGWVAIIGLIAIAIMTSMLTYKLCNP